MSYRLVSSSSYIGSSSYTAGSFSDQVAEKARTIYDASGKVISKGDAKTRFHLMSYNGDAGKDLYAVAAEQLTPEERKDGLGLIDRHFYVIYEPEKGVAYKINRNSLQKRLNLSKEEMEDLTKSGNCDYKKLQECLAQKSKLEIKWKGVNCQVGEQGQDAKFPTDTLAADLIHKGVFPNYKQIVCLDTGAYACKQSGKEEDVLYIEYSSDKKEVISASSDKPNVVVIQYPEYKHLMDGHALSEEILLQIDVQRQILKQAEINFRLLQERQGVVCDQILVRLTGRNKEETSHVVKPIPTEILEVQLRLEGIKEAVYIGRNSKSGEIVGYGKAGISEAEAKDAFNRYFPAL